MPARIIDGRYALTNEPIRHGGMSTVSKAVDLQTSRFCAIKRVKTGSQDDLRFKDSFNREYAALNELCQHPNIVELLDAGTDEAGFYMVLEWVPTNLVDLITRRGPLEWREFYTSIGRPILDALVYAQNRGWNHRDIKPQNILIDDNGIPKLSDYGIAKQFERPSLGLTFAQFRSAPFTPPEDDGGEWSCSRDCFSWAAVAVYCLSGKMPTDYGELSEFLASLDQSSVPSSLLQLALSHVPSERPPLRAVCWRTLTRSSPSRRRNQDRRLLCTSGSKENACSEFSGRSVGAIRRMQRDSSSTSCTRWKSG
jgi:serine/threonine protein kinase